MKNKKYYLEVINSSSNSLLAIIYDILDFSKIEAGKLEIDRIDFDLKYLLSNVQQMVEFKAKEKSLGFEIGYDKKIPFYLYGDSLRISQILLNLINNAVKFTEKGFVKIFISNDGDDFLFEIKDSGIGMSETQLSNLFQSFSQADGSTTRKYGGTGLGLSISKQLVELMDGTISVESEPNKGSTFSFRLNLPKSKNHIKKEPKNRYMTEELSQLNSSNILLVEDNKINQEIIVGVLENSGINIDIANNGAEAIKMYQQNSTKYELILMDLQMPIMGGLEATTIIRKTDKKIPIIALTANAMKEDVEQTKKVGMDGHLSKPINVDIFYEMLLKYILKKDFKCVKKKEQPLDSELVKFKNIDTERGLKHLGGNKKRPLLKLQKYWSKICL